MRGAYVWKIGIIYEVAGKGKSGDRIMAARTVAAGSVG